MGVASSLAQLLEKLADLLDAHADEEPQLGPGEGNFRCSECEGCYDCRFCVGCSSCERCTYCEGCEECVDCTQCKNSYDLESSSHCEHARSCRSSQYLTLCFDCDECTQCFACVGLEGQEFCILNQHVPKNEYFKVVKALRAELAVLTEQGFLPAFEEDPDAWFDALGSGLQAEGEEEVTEPFDVDRPAAPAPSRPGATWAQRPVRSPARPPETEKRGADGGRGSFLRVGRRPPRS